MTFPYSKKHRFVGRYELQLVHEPESVCGDLVPSPEAGEPKGRVSRTTEGENSRSRAEGNRRDASFASGATVCRREAYLFGSGGASSREGRSAGSRQSPLLCNHTTII